MFEPEIWTFFYGSYMNFDVLREVNYIPKKWKSHGSPASISSSDRVPILFTPTRNLFMAFWLLALTRSSAACMGMPRMYSVRPIFLKLSLPKRLMESGSRPFAISAQR